MVCVPCPNHSGDKIENNEMGGDCSTYGDMRGVYRVLWGNMRERDLFGDPGSDGTLVVTSEVRPAKGLRHRAQN